VRRGCVSRSQVCTYNTGLVNLSMHILDKLTIFYNYIFKCFTVLFILSTAVFLLTNNLTAQPYFSIFTSDKPCSSKEVGRTGAHEAMCTLSFNIAVGSSFVLLILLTAGRSGSRACNQQQSNSMYLFTQ